MRSSFRPYTSKQVGDTGPAESARRSNSLAFRSSSSGARGTTAATQNNNCGCYSVVLISSHYKLGALGIPKIFKNLEHFFRYIKKPSALLYYSNFNCLKLLLVHQLLHCVVNKNVFILKIV